MPVENHPIENSASLDIDQRPQQGKQGHARPARGALVWKFERRASNSLGRRLQLWILRAVLIGIDEVVTELDPKLERALNATGRLGARLEGRVFSTFVDSESSFFCSSAGGAGACLIQLDGTVLTQWEARAGLVFRF